MVRLMQDASLHLRLTPPAAARGAVSGRTLQHCGFGLASLVLAVDPAVWLWRTWTDPSYASGGWPVAVAVGAIAAWSLSSGVVRPGGTRRLAFLLLVAAALLRLAGQVLAISVLGGFALVLDAYAVLALLRVTDRARAVSPLWLAGLFAMSLPLERIAQRALGYPMQEVSAAGACSLLRSVFDDVACEGVRLRVAKQDVLVDLPCSGTQALMLSIALVFALFAVQRPALLQAAFWLALAVALSVALNAVRIAVIAVLLVHRDATGIDPMAEPWHDLIGYATLALSVAPVIFGLRADGRPRPVRPPTVRARGAPSAAGLASALACVPLALAIVAIPARPVDVSRPIAPFALPAIIDGEAALPRPLAPSERRYFETYGGHAAKADYGLLSLTLVRTSSPLRHLHAPDDCLRGLGFDVVFLGTRFEPVPTALYRATDASGRSHHVAVTFVSDAGHATSNVAEAIWRWLAAPGSRWTSVQRITPWHQPAEARAAGEAGVIAALRLNAIDQQETGR